MQYVTTRLLGGGDSMLNSWRLWLFVGGRLRLKQFGKLSYKMGIFLNPYDL